MPQKKPGKHPLELSSVHPYKLLPCKFDVIKDPIATAIYFVCSVCECRLIKIESEAQLKQIDTKQGYLCESCHSLEKVSSTWEQPSTSM